MQRGDDYMMRQIPTSYTDNPTMTSASELQNYYDDPSISSQPGIHAPSSSNLPPPNFRNSQPSGYAEAPYMPPSNPNQYENLEVPRNSDWLEKTQRSNKRSKYIVVGSVLTVAALIAIGVALGVVLSRKNGGSGSSGSGGSSSSSGGTPVGTNPNDPSNFQKNPALQQAFWGIAYTPLGSQLPECGVTLESVIEDVQLMSQITTNIRLYGADCNQSSLVLAAIQETQVNLNVWLGNYPSATDNGTAYERQKGEIQTALQQYGAAHVSGVTVGNEVILDYITQEGQTDPNGSAGNTAGAMLVTWIQDTRNMISSLNLGKTIQVGNAEAGSYFNTRVLEAVDYGMSNVHPWFANQSIQDAAGWTWEFFEENNVEFAATLSNNPHMYIAETGWPTNSSTFNYNPNDGPSVASVANLQYFINTFACPATQNGTQYFFFEYQDQPWQDVEYGGVEGYWGLFDANKNFKNLNLTACT